MNLPDVNPDDFKEVGNWLTTASQTYLGKKLLKLVGKRYEDASTRRSKQLDAFDETTKALEIAKVESEISLLKFRTELDKGDLLAAYVQRSGNRLISEQIRKDYNIDTTYTYAAEQVVSDEAANPSEEEQDDTEVKEDWFMRWTSIVEDISEEEAQRMWARVLAGEIKKPGSYPLRSLEILKNLSRDEATTFTRIAGQTVGDLDTVILFGEANDYNNQGKRGIFFSNLLEMEELGLMQVNSIQMTYNVASSQQFGTEHYLSHFLFMHAKRVFLVGVIGNKVTSLVFPCMKLTKAGGNLIRLIDAEINNEIVKHFVDALVKAAGDDSSISDIQVSIASNILFSSDFANYSDSGFIPYQLS